MALPLLGEGLHARSETEGSAVRYHVTVLSNFARGYDKYSGLYSKVRIPESTFPDRFFLLRREEIDIGVAKASRLLGRVHLEGDRLLVLETRVLEEELRDNMTTGLGRYIDRPHILVTGVFVLNTGSSLEPWAIEDATARSLRALHPQLLPYEALVPRSVSLLPIARGCQARCGVRSIAFPAIGCGAYRFPIDRAAKIATATITDALISYVEIESVLLVAFDERVERALRRALAARP